MAALLLQIDTPLLNPIATRIAEWTCHNPRYEDGGADRLLRD